MKLRSISLASALLVSLWVAPVSADTGTYRLVTGTLVWPNELPGQPRAVVRGDDGVNYVAELEAAPSSSLGSTGARPRAGDRVTVLGRDGFQAGQLLEARIEPASPTVAGLVPPATGASSASTPGIVAGPGDTLGRLAVSGSVTAIGPSTVTVQTTDGRSVTVDVSRLDAEVRSDLRSGDSVVFYVPEQFGGTPIAQGIVVDRSAPSSSPRFPR